MARLLFILFLSASAACGDLRARGASLRCESELGPRCGRCCRALGASGGDDEWGCACVP